MPFSISKLISLAVVCGSVFAQEMPIDHSNHIAPVEHKNHMMTMMMTGQTLVMNQNTNRLPNGC